MDWTSDSVEVEQEMSDACQRTEFNHGVRTGIDTLGFAKVQQHRNTLGHVWSNHISNSESASGFPNRGIPPRCDSKLITNA